MKIQVRESILKEFERLLGESGYNKTTIQQIANNCGISKGHITFYFKKKEDILSALFKNFSARLSIIENDLRLEESPIEEFFVIQLFTFYILENKDDYYKKISELSVVTKHLDDRVEAFYRYISNAMEKVGSNFEPDLLETVCVSMVYTLYGIIGHRSRKSCKIEHIELFNATANCFFMFDSFKNIDQYKERALNIFNSLNREKLLERYNVLFGYDYAK